MAIDRELIQALRAVEGLGVRLEVPLAPYTSIRVGGSSELLLMPRHLDALRQALLLLEAARVPWFALGNGSNLLVRDGGVRGAVFRLDAMAKEPEVEGTRLRASSATLLVHLIQEAHRHGLVGLEWAAGIPGSVGGAVVMNAGCHGQEVGRFVEAVTVLEPDGTLRHLSAEALGFGYRRSVLHGARSVVVAATFRLVPGDAELGRQELRHYLQVRRRTQPVGLSAGSMFKNPPGDFAGRLIEQVGGKGRRLGDAEISPLHANFIVNHGRARAADVLGLAAWAKEQVQARFGVTLELEVDVVGEEKAP